MPAVTHYTEGEAKWRNRMGWASYCVSKRKMFRASTCRFKVNNNTVGGFRVFLALGFTSRLISAL